MPLRPTKIPQRHREKHGARHWFDPWHLSGLMAPTSTPLHATAMEDMSHAAVVGRSVLEKFLRRYVPPTPRCSAMVTTHWFPSSSMGETMMAALTGLGS